MKSRRENYADKEDTKKPKGAKNKQYINMAPQEGQKDHVEVLKMLMAETIPMLQKMDSNTNCWPLRTCQTYRAFRIPSEKPQC